MATLAPMATPAATAIPEPCDADGYCGVLSVGGALTAAAWLDESRMYLAQYDGRIQLLNVDTGEVRDVLDGLSIPQGLTALDGRLYVTDLGNLCELLAEMQFTESEISRCTANTGIRSDAEMLELFRRVNARVMSYRIRADGGIDQPRQVVGRILTSSRDHSANGLVNDGEWVYVSIGHPGHYPEASGGLFAELEQEIAASGGRTDLSGTIARFRPPPENAEAEVEVWASGLRNTYGISIAPDGTIYGGDNDSQDGLADCCQREELNAIVPGGFYGFPYWGTNLAPPEAGVIEPAAVLEGTVSTFAHANESGVYVAYLHLGDAGGGLVIDRFEYETFRRFRILSNSPLVTAILEREGLLYLAAMSGEVHIIDPAAAPITARQ